MNCVLHKMYYNKYMRDYAFNGYGAQNEGRNRFEGGSQNEAFSDDFPGGMEQRLFNKLMTDGNYADLDKAKHNPQYRSYLMENYEDEMPF